MRQNRDVWWLQAYEFGVGSNQSCDGRKSALPEQTVAALLSHPPPEPLL
jgi:hypothetical protein